VGDLGRVNREQAFLVVMVAATALASLLILLPFLNYVLAALLLGYVLRPLHRRLTPYLGKRIAAITVIIGALVALLLPLAYIGWVLYNDALELARGESELDLVAAESRLESLTGQEIDVQTTATDVGQLVVDSMFGNLTELVGLATTLALGLALLLFLVYYVLLDGPAFVQWAVDVAPVDDAIAHRLVARMDRMTWGVVAGHILVAFVQGIVGGVGLWLAGVPSPVFWGAVMVFTALLPIIGAFLVWGPAAAYLYLIDESGMALFLAIWGVFVVSLVDNYLRSIVIDQSAEVNPGVILVGVVGGIYTLGSVGLFVGPIVIGLFAATIRAFDDHYDALSYETPPPEPPDDGRLSWLATDPRALRESTGHREADEGDDGGATGSPAEAGNDGGAADGPDDGGGGRANGKSDAGADGRSDGAE